MAAAPSMSARLSAQLDFLLTCDRLKTVLRTTRLHDGSRLENSAEHSWHLALLALANDALQPLLLTWGSGA